MTGIGRKLPGEVTAEHFAKAAQRVNPSQEADGAEEFNAAKESVRKREDAQSKVEQQETPQTTSRSYGIDPAIRETILRQTGRDVDPDPKP